MSTHMLQPRDTLALILAGGRVNELAALTLHRPKSAMPFGGIFRVIDCALSNLSSTGVNRVGILSQYRPSSLMDHVRDGRYWDFKGTRRSLSFLPPHTGESDSDWYKGTADALYQNLAFIQHHKKPLTLIVSGDHIYRMDYRALFEVHRKTGADMTMSVTPVDRASANRFGLAELDDSGHVTRYEEKPAKPFSSLASMTVYLFNTEVLIEELQKNAQTGHTFQIYDEILPELVKQGRVAAYCHNGYWAYSRTIEDYYKANMDCLGIAPVADLDQWRMHTNQDAGRVGDHPPVLAEESAVIQNSIVSPGCRIKGKVINSVISPVVTVEHGAEIVDSIILDGVYIGKNTKVNRAVIDKNVHLGDNVQVGKPVDASQKIEANRHVPTLLDCGLTIIGKKTRIPDNITIGTNVIIYPEVERTDFSEMSIKDGTTVITEQQRGQQ